VIYVVAAASGGSGRTVVAGNVAYRLALAGRNVCYVDFNFEAPTAGALFGAESVRWGTSSKHGLHSYLMGNHAEAERLNVWQEGDGLGRRPTGAGRLALLPGDRGGGEFSTSTRVVRRCFDLLIYLREEFDTVFVDLSAGRSFAAWSVLAALYPEGRVAVPARWLVFCRWTRPNILAAENLVHGEKGLLEKISAADLGIVRTMISDPAALRGSEADRSQQKHSEFDALADDVKIGAGATLGSVPFDPLFEWQEQVIPIPLVGQVDLPAGRSTLEAFDDLAERLKTPDSWYLS
jgi:hypothetical protein